MYQGEKAQDMPPVEITLRFGSVVEMLQAFRGADWPDTARDMRPSLPPACDRIVGAEIPASLANAPAMDDRAEAEAEAESEALVPAKAAPAESVANPSVAKPKRTRTRASKPAQAEAASVDYSPSEEEAPPLDEETVAQAAIAAMAPIDAVLEDKVYTPDDIAQTLSAYNKQLGMDATRGLLSRVGATRRSEIVPELYGKFMALAHADMQAGKADSTGGGANAGGGGLQ